MTESEPKGIHPHNKISDRDIARLATVFPEEDLPDIIDEAIDMGPRFIDEFFEEYEKLKDQFNPVGIDHRTPPK